ncbi:MAG TPA: hypothetical protein VIJ37_04755 [Steroidobacteraceae bacterium]
MSHINAKWRILAAASVAAASLAACHNDHNNGSAPKTPPPPPPTSVDFSTFAKNAFAANANTTPISLDGVNFAFDVDNEPTAFDALVMSGTY